MGVWLSVLGNQPGGCLFFLITTTADCSHEQQTCRKFRVSTVSTHILTSCKCCTGEILGSKCLPGFHSTVLSDHGPSEGLVQDMLVSKLLDLILCEVCVYHSKFSGNCTFCVPHYHNHCAASSIISVSQHYHITLAQYHTLLKLNPQLVMWSFTDWQKFWSWLPTTVYFSHTR